MGGNPFKNWGFKTLAVSATAPSLRLLSMLVDTAPYGQLIWQTGCGNVESVLIIALGVLQDNCISSTGSNTGHRRHKAKDG